MKKKGLIISTIVMVVVLVASLSTATYAWFSSTAQATVSNIAINTVAAAGLQVAVKGNAGDYYYGDMQYSVANGFNSASEGWGANVDFKSITDTAGAAGGLGSLDSAVALVKANKKIGSGAGTDVTNMVYDLQVNSTMETTYSLINGNAFTEGAISAGVSYVKQGDTGMELAVVTNATIYNRDSAYYIKNTAFKVGDYLLPIGYNIIGGDKVPYGFTVAVPNSKYLDLPISVKPTVDVQFILCTLTLTPNSTTAMSQSTWDACKPGMAAATFIEIKDNAAGGGSAILEPYSNVTLNGGAVNNPTADAFVFKFVVAMNVNGTTVKSVVGNTSIVDYSYKIWIEGTDGECKDITAGSMYKIDISYDYVNGKGEGVDVTSINTSGTISSGWKATSSAEATGITMASKSYTGIVKYRGTHDSNNGIGDGQKSSYYILPFTHNFYTA